MTTVTSACLIANLEVQPGAVDEELLAAARSRALPVVKKLATTLEGQLKKAMGKGGPVAAISVCRSEAMTLTQTVREEAGINYLKRVGVRVRNPDNRPDQFEKAAMDYFLAIADETGTVPEDYAQSIILPDGSGQLRYYRAIRLQARCLPCHGPEARMPQVIRTTLDSLYMEDEARGFEVGELRGLMVVGLDPQVFEIE